MRLTKKEKSFCNYFLKTGSFDKAKEKSKIKKIILRSEVLDEISKLFKEKNKILSIKLNIIYQKLAFGNINDAVVLMMKENLTENEIKKLDLFCVSGIKKLKNNIEVTFFDRIKALQKLEELNNKEQSETLEVFFEKIKTSLNSDE